MMFPKNTKKKKKSAKKNALKKCRINDPKLRAQFKKNPCIICKQYPTDPCHIRSRGAGGDDVPDNLISLCRSCHIIQHQYGLVAMAEKYPQFRWVLENKGWKIVERFGQKKLEYDG